LTDKEIESLADEVLVAYDMTSIPVSPVRIATAEAIRLLPGDYDGCFDARLEYRKSMGKGRFYLLYAERTASGRSEGRVRFSIAHELGHFYIPEHRKLLLSGISHNSHVDFISDRPLEKQADCFAASLLLPYKPFCERVTQKKGGFCTLSDLIELAALFQASITSTAIRYAKLNFESCCVVVSKYGRILYAIPSDDMRRIGLGWIQRGQPVPTNSVTAKCRVSKAILSGINAEGTVDTGIWFEDRGDERMWEEAMLLGRTGLTLTFLSVEQTADDD
jgi:hypothetical protein